MCVCDTVEAQLSQWKRERELARGSNGFGLFGKTPAAIGHNLTQQSLLITLAWSCINGKQRERERGGTEVGGGGGSLL